MITEKREKIEKERNHYTYEKFLRHQNFIHDKDKKNIYDATTTMHSGKSKLNEPVQEMKAAKSSNEHKKLKKN